MTPIVVRPMEPRDLEAIHEIMSCPRVVANTLQLPLRSLEERRERFQRTPDSHSLVAEIDGRVVGTLGLRQETRPRLRHSGSMGIAVHDDFAGRGIGSSLLAAMVDLADNWLNLQRIELTVYVDNAPAIHLYTRWGFEIEGTARRHAFRQGVFVDAYMMARLSPSATMAAVMDQTQGPNSQGAQQ